MSTDNIEDIFKKMSKEAEAFYDGEKNDNEEKIACIQIMETETKGAFYFDLKKEQEQWLKIERKTTEAIEVNLSTSKNTSYEQQLIHFNPLAEALEISTSSEEPSGAKQLGPKQETEINQEDSNKKETVESKEILEEKKVEKKEVDEDISPKGSDTEPAEKNTKEKSDEDVEKEYSEESLPDLGTPESYKRILAVETKNTKDSLADLVKSTYEPEDSLKKAQYLTNAATNKPMTKVGKSKSPIIIRDVNLNVKTGSSSFDNDNSPGYDKDENNNIVRSFDKVSYLVSFSIQNTLLSEKYTNIRYRVIANLDNAVEIINNVPRNNAEISNGIYIDKDPVSALYYLKFKYIFYAKRNCRETDSVTIIHQ